MSLLISLLLLGQSPPAAPTTLTMEQAIEVALIRRPEIQVFRSRALVQRARVQAARTGWMPRIDASLSVTNGLGGSTGKLGIEGLAASPFKSIFGMSVNLWWEYDFGRTSAATRAAEREVGAVEAATDSQRLAIGLGVSRIYLRCALEGRRAVLLGGLIQARELSLEAASSLQSGGLGNAVDVELAAANLSEARRQKLELELSQRRCLLELAFVMGEEPTRWSLVVPGNPPKPASEETLVKRALATRPELVRLRRQASVLAARRDLISMDLRPVARVQVSGGWARVDERFTDNLPVYAVGFGLEIPLYDGGVVDADQAVIDARIQGISHERRSVEAGIKAEIRDAIAAGRSARREFSSAKTDVRRIRSLVDLARARYAENLGSYVPIAQAEAVLARAQSAVEQARFRLLDAHVRLRWASPATSAIRPRTRTARPQ